MSIAVGYPNDDNIHEVVDRCIADGAEFIVLAAEDVEFPDGWQQRAVVFMQHAPSWLIATRLYREPDAPVVGVRLAGGGVEGRLADAVPFDVWLFRASDWPIIAGRNAKLPESLPDDGRLICQRLSGAGYKFAQLDIVDRVTVEDVDVEPPESTESDEDDDV